MKNVAVAMALMAVIARAGADVRSEVKALYAKADSQLAVKSFSGFASLLRPHIAPGFTSTNDGKTKDFNGMIADIKGGVSQIKKITVCRTTIVNTVVTKTAATFKTERLLGWTTVAKDGKSHKFLLLQRSADTWTPLHGAWQLKSINWSADSKLTIDGKSS